jgi:hypothetical protein
MRAREHCTTKPHCPPDQGSVITEAASAPSPCGGQQLSTLALPQPYPDLQLSPGLQRGCVHLTPLPGVLLPPPVSASPRASTRGSQPPPLCSVVSALNIRIPKLCDRFPNYNTKLQQDQGRSASLFWTRPVLHLHTTCGLLTTALAPVSSGQGHTLGKSWLTCTVTRAHQLTCIKAQEAGVPYLGRACGSKSASNTHTALPPVTALKSHPSHIANAETS